MANSFSHADRLRDDVDWSVSHRAPPPIPHGNSPVANFHAYSDDSAVNLPPFVVHHQPAQQPLYSPTGPLRDNAAIAGGDPGFGDTENGIEPGGDHNPASSNVVRPEGRRRSSFSFLRKSSNSNSTTEGRNARSGSVGAGSVGVADGGGSVKSNSGGTAAGRAYTTFPNAPPLPVTRIAQAHAAAAADPNNRHFRNSSQNNNNNNRRRSNSTSNFSERQSSSGDTHNMLRKASRLRKEQAEQERKAREAAQLPQEPPHLPSLQPLPGIPAFGGEDPRSSLDPESHVNGYNNVGAAKLNGRPTARSPNFSRPSTMSSSNVNNSSSPAYAVRPGFPLASQSSSPDMRTAGNGEYVTIGERVESMANRGRYSYASQSTQINAASSPRRVRRRKDPTPFNILVIGAKSSGKTSFISFLRHSLALPSHKQPTESPPDSVQINGTRSSFTSHYLETEMDGERVGLTVWDSVGLEKNIVDLQLREMSAFVEAKFEDTFVEEQKVMRSPGVKDTHIHCAFLVLDPVRLDSSIAESTGFPKGNLNSIGLDQDLDLQVMRALWGKTTVIPVISKADTLTVGHMAFLKRAVWKSLKRSKLDPLEALELEDDSEGEDGKDTSGDNEDDSDALEELIARSDNDSDDLPVSKPNKKGHNRQSSLSINGIPVDDDTPYIPMSILSPDPYDLPPYVPKSKVSDKVGRRFPWGFADPYDPDHCDFGRLRDSVFSEWRSELRELSRTKWYENWRTSRLKNVPGSRQRVRGGVTPVSAVPTESRAISQPTPPRQYGPTGSMQSAARQTTPSAAVPRSVSQNSSQQRIAPGMAMTTVPENGRDSAADMY